MKSLLILITVFFIHECPAFAQLTFNKVLDYRNGAEFGKSIILSDTGYVFLGYSRLNGEKSKIFYSEITTNGTPLIKKVYGYQNNSLYGGTGGYFKKRSNGGYIGAGTVDYLDTSNDFALYVLDDNGDSSMFKFYGKPNQNEIAYAITEMPDGGYVMVGVTGDYFAHTLTSKVVRTDSIGNLLWDTTYGGFGNNGAINVNYIGNDLIVIGGTKYSYGNGSGASWLYAINDKDKQIVWQKFYSGTWFAGSAAFNLTSDGGFILYSMKDTMISGIMEKVNYLRKLDNIGNPEWHTEFIYNNHKSIWMARETPDGGFIYCGDLKDEQNEHKGFIGKLDSAGNPLWERHYQYNTSSSNYLADIQPTPDGGYIAVGMTHDQTQDAWVLKVDSMGCLIPGCHLTGVNNAGTEGQLSIYPNPSSGNFKISYSSGAQEEIAVTIFDMAGRQVYQKRYASVSGKFEEAIDISPAPAGIYFVEFKTSKYRMIRKVVVE